MTDRELMQQVLDALESVWLMDRTKKQRQTIEALRARLALHDMNKAAEQNGEEL